MMAKNKHIISSRDSKQGRRNSGRECSHLLHGVASAHPGSRLRGGQRGPEGPQALLLCAAAATPSRGPCLASRLTGVLGWREQSCSLCCVMTPEQ